MDHLSVVMRECVTSVFQRSVPANLNKKSEEKAHQWPFVLVSLFSFFLQEFLHTTGFCSLGGKDLSNFSPSFSLDKWTPSLLAVCAWDE